MASAQEGGLEAARDRVVLLARELAFVPEQVPWGSEVESVLWLGEPGYAPEWADRVDLVGGTTTAPTGSAALRAQAARLRSSVLARRHGVDPAWLWTLKSDRALAGELRGADLLIVLDAQTQLAVQAAPDLTRGVPTVPAERAAAMMSTITTWGTMLDRAEELLPEPGPGPNIEDESRPEPEAIRAELAELLGGLVEVPAPLRGDLPLRTEVVVRSLMAELPPGDSATLLEDVLVPLVGQVAPDLGNIVAVGSASAALLTGSRVPDEAEFDTVVRERFSAADAALDNGDRDLATARAHDALSLLLHRARHASFAGSPIADDATAFLVPFTVSRVSGLFRGDGPIGGPAAPPPKPKKQDPANAAHEPTAPAGPSLGSPAVEPAASTDPAHGIPTEPAEPTSPTKGTDEAPETEELTDAARPTRPQVLILPGAYGAFHQDLVDSLSPLADVRAPDLPRLVRILRRRRPTVADLEVLSGLRRGEIDIARARWRNDPERTRARHIELKGLRALWQHMTRADIVVSDWIDAGGMWASQVCPPGVRLVLRAHSLDLLDPWVHLVDWRTVDEVLVSNDGMGEIYRELTAGTRAPHGISVRPHRPDLPQWRRPKSEQARFTIGMVGWGRAVKDPMWALDLLERDERRRLVLIGGEPTPQPYADARAYLADFQARLDQPHLRDRVTIVGQTADVAGELEQVGIVLSSSIREGWHLGLIEGVASGAVPVVRDWPLVARHGGARSLFPPEWVVADVEEADARIAALADPQAWQAAADRAHAQVLELFAAEPAAQTYRDRILGR